MLYNRNGGHESGWMPRSICQYTYDFVGTVRTTRIPWYALLVIEQSKYCNRLSGFLSFEQPGFFDLAVAFPPHLTKPSKMEKVSCHPGKRDGYHVFRPLGCWPSEDGNTERFWKERSWRKINSKMNCKTFRSPFRGTQICWRREIGTCLTCLELTLYDVLTLLTH